MNMMPYREDDELPQYLDRQDAARGDPMFGGSSGIR